jgi:hypothetical protein
MQTLVIDTNGIVKKLEQRGFSRSQAEGITEALKELDTSALTTKADLKDLRLDTLMERSPRSAPIVSVIA